MPIRSIGTRTGMEDEGYLSSGRPARLCVSNRRKTSQRGSTILEFGFVLIPSLGCLFLSINIAWIFFGWACLQSAVREGVRYGITGPVTSGMDSAVTTFVNSMAIGFLNHQNNPKITIQYFSPTTYTEVTGQSGATTSGNVLKITASISIPSMLPVWHANGTPLGTFIPWSVPLAAAAADVLETSTPPPSE